MPAGPPAVQSGPHLRSWVDPPTLPKAGIYRGLGRCCGCRMKLSDNLFREVIKGLKLPDGRAQRVPLVGRATIIPCTPHHGNRPAAVVVRDLSPTGIGIVHLEELQAGEQFILCPPGLNARDPRLIMCSIVHCEPLEHGLFGIGATFVKTLTAGPGDFPVLPVEGLVTAFRREAAAALQALEEGDAQFGKIEERMSRA